MVTPSGIKVSKQVNINASILPFKFKLDRHGYPYSFVFLDMGTVKKYLLQGKRMKFICISDQITEIQNSSFVLLAWKKNAQNKWGRKLPKSSFRDWHIRMDKEGLCGPMTRQYALEPRTSAVLFEFNHKLPIHTCKKNERRVIYI